MQFGKSLSIALFATVAMAQSLFGAYDVIPWSQPVRVGAWCRSYKDVMAKANAEKIPVVVYFGKDDCSNCKNLKANAFSSALFKDWMASSEMLFLYANVDDENYLVSDGKPQDWGSSDILSVWALFGTSSNKKPKLSLPMMMVYWPKPNGTLFKEDFLARSPYKDAKGGDASLIEKLQSLTVGFFPVPMPDQWDPGDATATKATAVAVAATDSFFAHTLSPTDKADWFTFPATNGVQYRVSFADVSTRNITPSVKIYTSLTNANKGSPTLLSSTFAETNHVFTATSTGAHYLSVTHASTDATAGASYAISIREFPNATFSLATNAYEVAESAGNAVLTLTRSGRLTDAITVKFEAKAEADDTATSANFTALSTNITFAANETEKTVAVKVKDVAGNNGDKTFSAIITAVEAAGTLIGSPAKATVTIKDVDLSSDPDDLNGGNETQANATILPKFEDLPLNLRFDHYLSNSDTDDWFKIELDEATTYQLRVTDFETRPGIADPTVVDVYFGETRVVEGTSLSAMKANPLRITAITPGTVYIHIKANGLAGQIVRYNMEYRKWVLPVVTFETNRYTCVSLEKTATILPIKVIRSLNKEEAVSVLVFTTNGTATAGADYTAISKIVDFAAGETERTVNITIPKDNGLWKPNRTFNVRISPVANETIQITGTQKATVTLRTSLPAADANDGGEYAGGNGADGAPDGATQLTMQRRRSLLSATLNGTDLVDWYEFTCNTATEYSIKLRDVVVPDGLAITAEIYANGLATPTHTLNAANNYTITPDPWFTPSQVPVYLKVSRSANTDACVKYTLAYGEWVPAKVSFAADAISISEKAASIPVSITCTVEDPVDVEVAVWTEEGTATSPGDFVAVATNFTWVAADFATTNSRTRTLTIALTNNDSVWEDDETFTVKLDSPDASMSDDCITELTITILEKDKAIHGTLAYATYSLEAGVTNAYKTAAIPVMEGDAVTISLTRLNGAAGAAASTLTWPDGSLAASIPWASLQTHAQATIIIPSAPNYTASKTQVLTLKTQTSGVSVQSGKSALKFNVTSRFESLKTYRADPACVPFTASGDAWFASGSLDSLRSATLASGKTATMSATLTGNGTLGFTAEITGSGELTATVGGTVHPLTPGANSLAIPAGSQTVKITFKATAINSYAALSSITWIPGEALLSKGTFIGFAGAADETGRLTATISATRTISGKLELPTRGTYTFKGTLGPDNTLADFSATRSRATPIDGLTLALTVEANGTAALNLSQAGTDLSGSAYRDPWSDKPTAPATPTHLAGQYLTATINGQAINHGAWADIYGSGYFTMTISTKGKGKYAGVLADGTSFSGSSPLLVNGDSQALAVIYNTPRAYAGGYLLLTPAIQPGESTFTLGSGLWVNLASSASAYSPNGSFHRVIDAFNGGIYSKKTTLADFYSGGIQAAQFNPASAPEALYSNAPQTAIRWGSSAGAITFALNGKGTAFTAINTDPSNRMTLSAAKATGLVNGKIRADFPSGNKTLSWKGILIQTGGEGITAGRGFYPYSAFAGEGEALRNATESGDVELNFTP